MTLLLDTSVLDELEAELAAADVVTLLNLFLETTPGLVDSLTAAIDADDGERVTSAAHRLKGGCLAIGAEELAAVAGAIERGEPAAAEQIDDCWQRTAAALRARIALQH